jgi:hypothetical protein
MAKIYDKLDWLHAAALRYVAQRAGQRRMEAAAAAQASRDSHRERRDQDEMEQARLDRAERFARKVVKLHR